MAGSRFFEDVYLYDDMSQMQEVLRLIVKISVRSVQKLYSGGHHSLTEDTKAGGIESYIRQMAAGESLAGSRKQ